MNLDKIQSKARLYSLDFSNGLIWCFDDMGLKLFVDAILKDNDSLTSAAPELLKALLGMLEVYGVSSVSPFNNATLVEVELCNTARAAISKATGT